MPHTSAMAGSAPPRTSSSSSSTVHQPTTSTSRPFITFCSSTLRSTCPSGPACPHVHFERSLRPHTQISLGDCSYLNTCHRMNTCRYVHYVLEDPKGVPERVDRGGGAESASGSGDGRSKEVSGIKKGKRRLYAPNVEDSLSVSASILPGQWINADLRSLDFTVLGKFDVVVADPPWAIHQELPYGTLTDDEMMRMPVGALQDEGGLLFLWVTGRAMELGRDCLDAWGYERIDELIWVKANQLQGLIRTGRTGHWLNHSKEHCLVAIRRPAYPTSEPTPLPAHYRKGLDTQVILSEVRETSRKPDELYEMIERISPAFLRSSEGAARRSRKVELFGREHNVRDGWLTIGNQLNSSDRVYEKELQERFNQRYPERQMRLLDVKSTSAT